MPKTRGDLKPARIVDLEHNDGSVDCMFNPHEYKISKSNSFAEQDKSQAQKSTTAELKKSGPQKLTLKLYFDTYENFGVNDANKKPEDVSQLTRKLWKLMEPRGENKARSSSAGSGESGKDGKKGKVPHVAFQWGVFSFNSFITQMSQKFTLFLEDGTPVRAEVDITFTQYADSSDYTNKDSFVYAYEGSGTRKVKPVIAGDRIDEIAQKEYGDADKWREIAEHNNLTNPNQLRPGTKLALPSIF